MTGGNVLLASYTQSEHWVSVYDGGGGKRLCDKSTSVAEDSGRGANPLPVCQDPWYKSTSAVNV